MGTTNKMKLITLVDINRSTPGKVFETSMAFSKYQELIRKGKLGKQWVKKEEIESITVENVSSPEEAKIEIKKVVEKVEKTEKVEEKSVKTYPEMSLEELRNLANERGLKFHHASKEKKLIEILTEADNA